MVTMAPVSDMLNRASDITMIRPTPCGLPTSNLLFLIKNSPSGDPRGLVVFLTVDTLIVV
jgi:hypothetical protein